MSIDDIPTAFVLEADGFREISRLDYRTPQRLSDSDVLFEWDAIALSSNCGARGSLMLRCMKAWHHVERRMSARDRGICWAAVRTGMPLPGDYYDSPVERSARAFTAWAQYHLSRSWAPPPIPSAPRTAERLYCEVLVGLYRPSSEVVRVVTPAEPGIPRGLIAAYAAGASAAFNWLARRIRKLTGDYSYLRRTA